MRNHRAIPLEDLAFAYELYCQGLSWKSITRHVAWERTALIKAIARRLKPGPAQQQR